MGIRLIAVAAGVLLCAVLLLVSCRLLRGQRQFVDDVTFVAQREEVNGQVPLEYFDRYNGKDKQARRCGRTEQACREQYLSAIRAFSDNEMRRVRSWVASARARVQSHPQARALRRLLRDAGPWRICKLADHVEGGFPHTHGDIIFLPQSFVSSSSREEWEADKVRTMVHEWVHVAQRREAPLVRELYARFWGLSPVHIFQRDPRLRGELAQHLRNMRRSNPDVDEYIYHSQTAQSACIQLYTTSKDDDRLQLTSSYAARVADGLETSPQLTCAYEHPNEAMAYLLADLIVPPRSKSDSQMADDVFTYSGLMEWLRWLAPKN